MHASKGSIFEVKLETHGFSGIFALLIFATVTQVSEMALIRVASSEEFKLAIGNVRSGDKIELLPTDYHGSFVLPVFSGGSRPVIIYGTSSMTTRKTSTIHPSVGQEDSTAFLVQGNNWILQNFVISGFNTAAVLQGPSNSMVSLVTENCPNGFKVIGQHSYIKACVITGPGTGIAVDVKGDYCSVLNLVTKATKYGLIISGQSPEVRNNVFTAEQTITVLGHVQSGILESNVLTGPMVFSGHYFTISNNVANKGTIIFGSNNNFISNVANTGIKISGFGNRFKDNVLNQVYFSDENFYDDGGNVFNYAEGSKRAKNNDFWSF